MRRVCAFTGDLSGWVYTTDVSPDVTVIATMRLHVSGHTRLASDRDAVRIYDSRDGYLLFDSPIRVYAPRNASLAWVSDNKLHPCDRWRQKITLWYLLPNVLPSESSYADQVSILLSKDGHIQHVWADEVPLAPRRGLGCLHVGWVISTRRV